MTALRTGTPPHLALGSMTHPGRVRRSNEDAFAALLPPNAPAGSGGLLIVCDGMGGHQAGGYASSTAVNAVVSFLRGMSADALSPDRAADTLRHAAEAANAQVHAEAGSADRTGMGTTLTSAIVTGPVLAIAHVGDSRAYLLRNGELALLTADHTWVADRVRRGVISREQAATHSRRNVLTRALGVYDRVEVDSATVEIEKGDVILLSSDGLHGSLSTTEIGSVLGALSPQEAAAELVERANAAGGPDNVTAVVAHVLSTGPVMHGGVDASPDATMTGGHGVGPRLANAVRRLYRRAS